MVRLCNILYESGIKILLCSGRREQDQSETVEWLAQQGVNYNELVLRRDGDRRRGCRALSRQTGGPRQGRGGGKSGLSFGSV